MAGEDITSKRLSNAPLAFVYSPGCSLTLSKVSLILYFIPTVLEIITCLKMVARMCQCMTIDQKALYVAFWSFSQLSSLCCWDYWWFLAREWLFLLGLKLQQVWENILFMEMAVLPPCNFVGNRQHYAKAVDSRIFRLFIDFFGGPAKFWSPRVKNGREIFYATQIILCKIWIYVINLSAQFLTNSGVTQKSLSS